MIDDPQRIARLMAMFGCSRETAVQIAELRDEGYPLYQAALMAGATDAEEPVAPKQTAEITRGVAGITVIGYAMIDGKKHRVGGFWFKPIQGALAKRLARAIEAGVVFTDLEVRALAPEAGRDGTWVSSRCHVLMRILNAELRRLGF